MVNIYRLEYVSIAGLAGSDAENFLERHFAPDMDGKAYIDEDGIARAAKQANTFSPADKQAFKALKRAVAVHGPFDILVN